MNMIREVKLGGFIVFQRKSDMYFNATRFINDHCNDTGKITAEDIITKFLEDKETEEIGRYINIDRPALVGDSNPFYVWFHPVLFIYFCSYVSVKMSYQIALTMVEMGGLLHLDESEEVDEFKEENTFQGIVDIIPPPNEQKCVVVYDKESDLYSFVLTFNPDAVGKLSDSTNVIFEMPGTCRKNLLNMFKDQQEKKEWYSLNENDIIEIYQMSLNV